MVDLANTVWRDFSTAGIPASGIKNPEKSKIREWGTYIESLTTAASYGNTVWFATKALLDADLAHAAGVPAIVYADTAAANNGIYIKSGASGAGSWGQIITYLPGYQFVTATDAGAGTANAIVATSSPRVAYTDGAQLIRLNIFETTTSGTVTVAFDGGAALTVQTASGSSPTVGGLIAGMTILGVVDQSASVFRMLSDQSGAAIQAAAEAAQAAAEAAAATVIAAAAATDPRTYDIELTEIGVAGAGGDQASKFNTMLAALDTAGGGRVDLQGLQVRVDSTLSVTGSNIVIENGGIDFSNAVDADKLFEVKGSQGSSVSFTAASRGVGSITVSSATGISEGGYLYLQSSDIFGVGGTARGEIQRVKSVSGTTIGFWKRTRDTYTTTPIFYKPTFLNNITFRNLVLTGKNDTAARQYAFDLEFVDGFRIEDVTSVDFGDRHYQITNCLGWVVSNCDARGISHGTVTGLSYGVTVNEASEDGLVIGCRFRDMKHGVTIGGETGVARHIKVTKCHASEIFDAAYDCHPQSQFITFEDCDCDNYSPIDSENGIVVQGANVKVINCRITGFVTCGVLAQPACVSGAITDDHYEIRGCEIRDGYGTSSYGVFLQNLRTSNELSFNIDNNTIFGYNSTTSTGIDVEIPAGKGLARGAGCSIDGNRITVKGTSIYMHTGASGSSTSIQNFSISGNKCTTSGAGSAVVQISSGQSGFIVTGNIQANVLYGGNYGILNSSSLAAHVATGGNVIRAWATGATSGTFASAGTNYTS